MPEQRAIALIRDRMKQQGVSGSELARQINTDRQFVSNLLLGRKGLTAHWVKPIASALDLDPDTLYASAGIVPPDLVKLITRSAKHIRAARLAVKLTDQETIK